MRNDSKLTFCTTIVLPLLFCIEDTHVKISQLVASLQTSRQQVVFNKFETSC